MAVHPPQVKTKAARSRTMSEAVQSRTVSETSRPRRMSEAVQPGIKLETVHPQPRPRAVQSQTRSAPPQPSESLFPGGYQFKVLMCRRCSAETSEKMVLWIVLIHVRIRVTISKRCAQLCTWSSRLWLAMRQCTKSGISVSRNSIMWKGCTVFLT